MNTTQTFLKIIMDSDLRFMLTSDEENNAFICIKDEVNKHELMLTTAENGEVQMGGWLGMAELGGYYEHGWNFSEAFERIEQLLSEIDPQKLIDELNK